MLHSAASSVRDLFINWRDCFSAESIEELMDGLEGIERIITLMLISLCFKNLRQECQSLCEIPLSTFESISKIHEYTEAIIKFGTTKDLVGRMFVLGNSTAGKTSLIHTLKSYGDNPKEENPKSILTGDDAHNDLEFTKVLDMVEDVKLSGNGDFKFELIQGKNDCFTVYFILIFLQM